jgi:16S rRNA pseudouridine516 synthase
MKLLKLIANLGYGSRRIVGQMIDAGVVTDADGRALSEKQVIGVPSINQRDATQSRKGEVRYQDVRVDQKPLDPAPGVVLLMNKPCGYTCSTRDPNLVVYDLLPPRFRLRDPIIAPIGRLDRQTSGLLLLTDDGALQHRITSPRTHLPKTYRAQLASPLRADAAEIFASGSMMLDGETEPLRAAQLEIVDAQDVRVTISEGRYHQVRRMFAALGNHVEALHRESIGGLNLGELPEGQFRILSADELRRVFDVGLSAT